MTDGGPAFPGERQSSMFGGGRVTSEGMSLRDWFAGMAMQGLLSGDFFGMAHRGTLSAAEADGLFETNPDKEQKRLELAEKCAKELVVITALELADAMLKARSQTGDSES